MKLLIAGIGAMLTSTGCGASKESAAPEPTTTSTTTTTTTTVDFTTTTTTTTTPTEPVSEGVEEEYDGEEEEGEDYGESEDYDDSATDWSDVLPGVWVAELPYAAPGEEFWSFNGNTGGAMFQFWPRGVGVGNPMDNGVAAPSSSGYLYFLDGDTLTVENALNTRVYTELTGDGGDCFTADHAGSTVEFCRYYGG
jgi:hypothetical protein